MRTIVRNLKRDEKAELAKVRPVPTRDLYARKLVGIIGSDKTKIQIYCQIDDLSEQLDQAVQQKDINKARALAEKIAKLKKKMGPEFATLVDIEKHIGLDSADGQEIASIVATLGESCGGE